MGIRPCHVPCSMFHASIQFHMTAHIMAPIMVLMMVHVGISWNGGTPQSLILVGFPIINHQFWGTPISGTPHSAYQCWWIDDHPSIWQGQIPHPQCVFWRPGSRQCPHTWQVEKKSRFETSMWSLYEGEILGYRDSQNILDGMKIVTDWSNVKIIKSRFPAVIRICFGIVKNKDQKIQVQLDPLWDSGDIFQEMILPPGSRVSNLMGWFFWFQRGHKLHSSQGISRSTEPWGFTFFWWIQKGVNDHGYDIKGFH